MAELEGLKRLMMDALQLLTANAIKELQEQGHVASGESIRSFETRIVKTFQGYVGEILGSESLEYIDRKIKPHFPPIQPLIRWAEHVKPGLSREERKSFAFAVASNMAKEGMPSSGAYSYSSNGRRLNWSEMALKASESGIDEIFAESEWIEREFENLLKGVVKTV